MLDFLHHIDTQALIAIHDWHFGLGDRLFPLLREKMFWIPLYVFLIVFLAINFRVKGWLLILTSLLTIGITDTLSSKVIKYAVKRPRPCHIEHIEQHLEMLVPCGGPFSFTSSHAANHFALAVLLIFTLGIKFPVLRWPLLIWAACIGLAQVYVGVHYPLDIVGGAMLGSLTGWFAAKYFNLRVGLGNAAH